MGPAPRYCSTAPEYLFGLNTASERDIMTDYSKKPLSAADILLGGAPSAGRGIFDNLIPPPNNGLGIFSEAYRRRSEWNKRFAHWEKPASVSEEGTIERAERNVRVAIARNDWLTDENVQVSPQGSYHNNTNVRIDADIDLRVVYPAVYVEYDPNVVQSAAREYLGYQSSGKTYPQVFGVMRSALTTTLGDAFGYLKIDAGNKAIRVKGITGSRAEVDVVPMVQYNKVRWNDYFRRYDVSEGVAILGGDGRWTFNFPEQHHANGKTKNLRTARRFKKVVRIVKRLRADMAARGIFTADIPSFFIECLVYAVEDQYFLVENDDAYDRVRRVTRRMRELVNAPLAAAGLTEINAIKPLFAASQPWRLETAARFLDAALFHLGDA